MEKEEMITCYEGGNPVFIYHPNSGRVIRKEGTDKIEALKIANVSTMSYLYGKWGEKVQVPKEKFNTLYKETQNKMSPETAKDLTEKFSELTDNPYT